MKNILWFLFSFNGRIGRRSFWLFTLTVVAVISLPEFFRFEAVTKIDADLYVTVASFIFLWPVFAVQAKRWHDCDKSGWWFFICFVPVIGGIWALIENGFISGTEGPNRFGNPPYQAKIPPAEVCAEQR
jgi:uncharacterized membrane protein YhaH (DUF805 family)